MTFFMTNKHGGDSLTGLMCTPCADKIFDQTHEGQWSVNPNNLNSWDKCVVCNKEVGQFRAEEKAMREATKAWLTKHRAEMDILNNPKGRPCDLE